MPSYKVAILRWAIEEDEDEIANIISDELIALGHKPIIIYFESAIPDGFDVVFTYAPYRPLIPILKRIANKPSERRPIVVHWNTEGLPDLRIPWELVKSLSAFRSWISRQINSSDLTTRNKQNIAQRLFGSWETSRVLRFRYVGDYYFASRKGWLNIYSDTSAIYARIHTESGLPTIIAPWGATKRWYKNLNLNRDIDVLWMGKRGTKRRSNLLNRVREELQIHGVEIYVADNEENPFIFKQERTQYLNRSKVILNLTRTWYDDNFSRFAMAASNRSLIVSEPVLPHCPEYHAGIHYVSAPIDMLAKTIVYYLKNETDRFRIVENAYQLVTTTLTFRNSIQAIMEEVYRVRLSL